LISLGTFTQMTMTIKDIFFEDKDTKRRVKVTSKLIPKIIPSPFIKAPIKLHTDIHKIGVDTNVNERKNLVFVFTDGTEKPFPESSSAHRNITIVLP
jgi:hypothetical protein